MFILFNFLNHSAIVTAPHPPTVSHKQSQTKAVSAPMAGRINLGDPAAANIIDVQQCHHGAQSSGKICNRVFICNSSTYLYIIYVSHIKFVNEIS